MTVNVSTRAALAIASGLAVALAFPNFDFNFAAWVAFVPLLYAIDGESPRKVFLYAWFQGFACYVASLYWIAITLQHFADVRVVLAIIPMVLLAGVVALFTAAAFGMAALIAARLRFSLVVTLPIVWAAVEWIHTYFPIGFPWNLLGYAAYQNLTLIQFAEFTGIYGVSALIVLFNVVIFTVVFRRGTPRLQGISLGVLSAVVAAAWVFGALRIGELKNERSGRSLKFAMVQGNIAQSIKWDPHFRESSFSVYVQQTEAAARLGADLIVWPEAAAAFFFQPTEQYPAAFADDAPYRQRLLQLAADTGNPILFGAPALATEDGRLGFYNRAYLVSGGGAITAWYDKMQLVPFGEYVPLRSVLGYFVNRVVAGFGDMFAGRQQTIFDLKGARLGVLICYESIFPNLARTAVNRGADILVNITNDAWYGESSAPYQLLAMAAMRAVETKVPMVRVANTGISAVIGPSGQITARTPLFKRGTEIERVYFTPRRTVYTIVGDLFAEICFALTAIALVIACVRPRRIAPLEEKMPEDGFRNGHGSGRLN
jgi:apolipoprotein N-acyltransferase